MSNLDLSLLSEQQAMEQWEEALAHGELAFNVSPKTTSVDSPKQNHQSTTENLSSKERSNLNFTDSSTEAKFLKSLGNHLDVDDVSAFRAVGLDLDTQQEIPFSELLERNFDYADELGTYPAPNALPAPTQPYFGDSLKSPAGFFGVLRNNELIQTTAETDGTFPEQFDGFNDFLEGHTNPEDQRFWDEILNGPLAQSTVDHAYHQATQENPSSELNKVWNARPALDELPAPEASASLLEIEGSQSKMRPPAVPLHSKPTRFPQQIHSQPDTPTEPSVQQGSKELLVTSPHASRKRTAPLSFADSPDDEALAVSHIEKKQKIQEVSKFPITLTLTKITLTPIS